MSADTFVRAIFYTYATVGLLTLVFMLSATVGGQYGFRMFEGAGAGTGPGEVYGDLIVASPRAAGYEIGDRVAVPLASGAAAVHRVRGMSVDAGTLHVLTRDSQQVDHTLRVRDAYGTVTFALPYLGFVLTWLSSWVGIALLLVVPMCMLAVDFALLSIRRAVRLHVRTGRHSRGNVDALDIRQQRFSQTVRQEERVQNVNDWRQGALAAGY